MVMEMVFYFFFAMKVFSAEQTAIYILFVLLHGEMSPLGGRWMSAVKDTTSVFETLVAYAAMVNPILAIVQGIKSVQKGSSSSGTHVFPDKSAGLT